MSETLELSIKSASITNEVLNSAAKAASKDIRKPIYIKLSSTITIKKKKT